MNQHSDIRLLLLSWIEGSLDEKNRGLVDEHLKRCDSCRRYFSLMAGAVLPSEGRKTSVLLPDPFLPTRVRAIADQSGAAPGRTDRPILRWAFRTAAFAVAVLLGVSMGESLLATKSTLTDQRIVAEYSESIESGGIGDRLQSVAQSTEEGTK